MRMFLCLLAACVAALLFAPLADAGTTRATIEYQAVDQACVPMMVAPLRVYRPAVVQRTVMLVEPEPMQLAYVQGERRLKLFERIRAKREFNKQLRQTRVATQELVLSRASGLSLGASSGCD